ncbi:MAG: hypothetical protein VW378_01820 [bacterium]
MNKSCSKKICVSILMLAITMSLTACGKKESAKPMIGQERVVEQSRAAKPGWLYIRPNPDASNLYFVGDDTARNISGVRDAYQVALSKVSFYINSKVDAGYKRIENNLDNDTANTLKQEMIQNVAKTSIQGAKEKEVYWEKVEKITQSGINYYYRVYSLVAVPKNIIQETAKATLAAQQAKHKEEENKKTYEQLKNIEGDFQELFNEN